MIDVEFLPSIFAVFSAFLFALSVQIQNLGMGSADPGTATLISIISATSIYWLASPFFLDTSYWFSIGTLFFAAVGLFRPALSAALAISSLKRMGPSLTSGIASISPLFGTAFGIMILGEKISLSIAIGTIGIVAGVCIASLRGGGIKGGWPIWVVALPIGAAFFRALGHPLTMLGMESVAEPLFAALVAYTVSSIVSFTIFKAGKRQLSKLNRNYIWFALAGIINGISVFFLNSALQAGKLLVVAPIASCSPIFAILLGYFIFKKETISWQTIIAIGFIVPGVIFVIIGDQYI